MNLPVAIRIPITGIHGRDSTCKIKHNNMSAKLYVGNLSFNTTESDINALFSGAGTVNETALVTDRETGRSRGFAFVTMSSEAEAKVAIERFSGADLDGRDLTVNEARPREEGGPRKSFGGGGGGGGRDNRGGGGGRDGGNRRY